MMVALRKPDQGVQRGPGEPPHQFIEQPAVGRAPSPAPHPLVGPERQPDVHGSTPL